MMNIIIMMTQTKYQIFSWDFVCYSYQHPHIIVIITHIKFIIIVTTYDDQRQWVSLVYDIILVEVMLHQISQDGLNKCKFLPWIVLDQLARCKFIATPPYYYQPYHKPSLRSYIPHICRKYHKWDMWRKICHVEKFWLHMHDRCEKIWNKYRE